MFANAQKENFSQIIASSFNLELHEKSWESDMRGNNDMMNKLHDMVRVGGEKIESKKIGFWPILMRLLVIKKG